MRVDAARASDSVRSGFEDGLGLRISPATRGPGETPVEILCFRHEITDVPAFDFALRERVARLSDLQHPYYARIRKVDRLKDVHGTVALVSDAAPGIRLIEILKDVERGGPAIDLNAGLYLVRQLMSAIGVLHQHARIAHGAIAPERLFVTSGARLLIVEHVLGAAIEQLSYSRERYWKELRVALPMAGGAPRFDERTDLTQIGVVALALILGRPLRDDEYPGQIEELLESGPLSSGLRDWLRRMLQLDARSSFGSISDAQAAFNQSLSENEKDSATAFPLEAFLTRYRASTAFEAAGSASTVIPVAPAKPIEPEPKTSAPDSQALEWLPAEETTVAGASELDVKEEPMRSVQPRSQSIGRQKWIAAGLLLAVTTTGAAFAARRYMTSAPSVALGTMTVTTDPAGAEVEIDGAKRGVTPLNLSLAAGAHTLVVRGNGESRTIPITLAAGAQISQYLEFPKKAPVFGQLQVRTEPAGARVTVDGVTVGKSPLDLAGARAWRTHRDARQRQRVRHAESDDPGRRTSVARRADDRHAARYAHRVDLCEDAARARAVRARTAAWHQRDRPHHAARRKTRD